jgi:asparagine synthase (glutamine-hydrolysing)
MCGVAGVLRPGGRPVETVELTAMMDTIRHRGPDDDGTWCSGGLGLGFVRLAIQDLSPNGAQPMVSADERWVIVFNGEIFNFLELRPTLRRVDSLRSTGDTEVLLELIAERGIAETLPALEGDFAFGLWDREAEELHLVRDRHGVKPLYWSTSGDELRFASEMKAITVGRAAVPDMTTVTATLLGLSGTWGETTVFAGIHSLRPGDWLTYRGSTEPVRRSFATVADFADEATWRELEGLSDDAVVDRVGAALARATDLRLISDAPVACLVSGGVDSSLVTVLSIEREPDIGL